MKNKMTYSDAFDELQSIVSEIESGDIAVDELTQRIARASELLQVCKTKLSASEEEVEKLLARLDQENEQGPER